MVTAALTERGKSHFGGASGLPEPEHPTPAQLQAYGDFAFLYLRSPHHQKVNMRMARLAIQPPIDLMQFHIFRFDGVPRFGVTWAFLDPEAERQVMRGDMIQPAQWRSGSQMWVMEIIAPYGQGTAKQAVRWLKRNVPTNVPTVRFMRVTERNDVRKVIEISRVDGKQCGTKLLVKATD